jgi:hypothetical protein
MSHSLKRAVTFFKIRVAERVFTSVKCDRFLQVKCIQYNNMYTEMKDKFQSKIPTVSQSRPSSLDRQLCGFV